MQKQQHEITAYKWEILNIIAYKWYKSNNIKLPLQMWDPQYYYMINDTTATT